MELVRRQIHMNRIQGRAFTQVTLDDDFIVPDTMDDMAEVILASGDILVETVKPASEKVLLKGKLDFQVLYRKEEGGLQALAGSIPFDEAVNVPGLGDRDDVSLSWELEDLSADMIHSRKLGVKALAGFSLQAECLTDAAAGSDVELAAEESAEVKKEPVEIASIAVRRRDTFRIQEELALPANKPNVDRLLWKEMSLRGVNTRPMDEKLLVSGSLVLFFLYAGEGEDTPVQWLEEDVPFSGEIELGEAREEMIPMVLVRLAHKELEAKPDYDGEMREVSADAVLDLDIRLYREEEVPLLSDVYSTMEELQPVRQTASFQQILAKNVCKCRAAEKVSLHNSSPVLQICRSDGSVKLDEVTVQTDSLLLEGVLEVSLLYLTSDDQAPIQAERVSIPFQCSATAAGINPESVYQVIPGLEQLTAVMLGQNTVEVKGVVSLEVLVQQPLAQPVIVGLERSPLDLERLWKLPGIVGYIVQPEDDLWKIAKNFHTTMDTIRRTNGLPDGPVKTGQKLILVKEIGNTHNFEKS
ncbi:MAG: DUF3794 domain-containing protein [Lachnospiraceae bacterium]|nr:DUF3794 domain-containing protein [Lachnospiraceae bacterium]